MGSQLDGKFLPGSLPHKFILIVILIICFVVNNFFSISLRRAIAADCYQLNSQKHSRARRC